MRKILFLLFFLFFFIILSSLAQKSEIERIKYPPLKDIKKPSYKKEILPNGTKIFFFKENEVPTIKIIAYVKGGKVCEEKKGVAKLVSKLLINGGTKEMDGDTIDLNLEKVGATIDVSLNDSFISISSFMMKECKELVTSIFFDVLTSPVFDEKKLELAKTILKSEIKRKNDDVRALSRREFFKLIYGNDSPYVYDLESEDVEKLKREDLLVYYKKLFKPENLSIAVIGDFDENEMKEIIVKRISKWHIDEGETKCPTVNIPPVEPSLNFIEKNDVEQTTILVGHLGVRFDDPDYPALKILSEILGGGMSSRIFVNIRTLKGLAYQARGIFAPEYDHLGSLYFFTSTKPQSTIEALKTIIEEIKKIRREGITDEELERAKKSYLNSYVFEFDTLEKVARRILTYDFFGYDENFNEEIKRKIEKVSKEDVLRVAKSHLFEDKLTILCVGKRDVLEDLKKLGEVNLIKLKKEPN